MFLVFTLRAILYKPFVRQIRTTRQMQELQPQIKALQKKYGKDRQRMALEMQKLQKEHGFNPILGCLPMLAQIPVFLGLYHVLRSFNRTQTGFGQLGLVGRGEPVARQLRLQRDRRRPLPGREPVRCAAGRDDDPDARASDAFTEFNRAAVIAVGVPLMILAGVATYFNSRASVARQSPEAAANPQTAMMNKLALYVFPLGVVVGGPFLPLAIILYWVANNIWTFGQQHYVFGKIEKEEEAKKEEAIWSGARRTRRPPGAKPKRQAQAPQTPAADGRRRTAAADVELTESGGEEIDAGDGRRDTATRDAAANDAAPNGKPATQGGSAAESRAAGAPTTGPRSEGPDQTRVGRTASEPLMRCRTHGGKDEHD